MAAPQIPNLKSLRNARGTSRGTGRGGLGSALSIEEERVSNDRIVQQTDQDASVSRLSAVEVGYLDDPFAKYFVPDGKGQRRFPIINRGNDISLCEIDQMLIIPKVHMSGPKPLTNLWKASSTTIPPKRSRSSPWARETILASTGS